MLKIFISHSTKDHQLVVALEKYLKSKGILAYIAERDYQIGKPLSNKIIENIETSDYLLVLYTSRGKESGFVNQEIGYWIKARGFTNFIPLVEKGIKTEGFISGLEYIEFDPENQNVSLSNTIHYIEQSRKGKEIELFGYNMLLSLGLIGLTALILYGIYKLMKE
ncbi:MAG: toll/interleukin-1 receptor domain-containing protein [Patescibacteria group bacterium]|nr:toll/interleukin-1 receptor domain-containing protein [Patescibacteria group bacterium]